MLLWYSRGGTTQNRQTLLAYRANHNNNANVDKASGMRVVVLCHLSQRNNNAIHIRRILCNCTRAISYSFQFLDAVDGAPVKFHTAANAIRPGAEHQRVTTNKFNVVRPTAVVRQIEVVRVCRPLGGDGVDLFHTRPHVQLLTALSNVHLCTREHTYIRCDKKTKIPYRNSAIWTTVICLKMQFQSVCILFIHCIFYKYQYLNCVTCMYDTVIMSSVAHIYDAI